MSNYIKRNFNYIPNQVTLEGIDEIQILSMAYCLKQNVALSGPPGVGKTELVEEFATLLSKNGDSLEKLFDITCDEYMTESPIVGYPSLSTTENGTFSKWVNGIASDAAEEGGILYLDEFDQLSGTVQKRLNSLFDERRRIRRKDGKNINAEDGFFSVISYNPTEKLMRADLEDSVADRFIHIPYNYLPSNLEESLILKSDIEPQNGYNVEKRGILFYDNKVKFLKEEDNNFVMLNSYASLDDLVDIFNLDDNSLFLTYQVSVSNQNTPNLNESYDRNKFGEKLVEFANHVRSFADYGTNQLDDNIKQYFTSNIGETTNVILHKPTVRILKAAIKQYDFLIDQGINADIASMYGTRLVINQIAYGKNGARTIGNKSTVKSSIEAIAEVVGLLPSVAQRTNFGNP